MLSWINSLSHICCGFMLISFWFSDIYLILFIFEEIWWILKIHSLRGIAGSFRRKSKPDLRLWTQREQDTVAHIGLCLGLAVARLNWWPLSQIYIHMSRKIPSMCHTFLARLRRLPDLSQTLSSYLGVFRQRNPVPGTQHIPAASQGHLNSLPQEFVVGLGPLGSCYCFPFWRVKAAMQSVLKDSSPEKCRDPSNEMRSI